MNKTSKTKVCLPLPYLDHSYCYSKKVTVWVIWRVNLPNRWINWGHRILWWGCYTRSWAWTHSIYYQPW